MPGNVYVRVKRNRDEYPLEHLCIIEDSNLVAADNYKKRRSIDRVATQLSELSTSSTNTNNPKRLVLKRIRTTDRSDDEAILNSDQISVSHTTSSSSNNSNEMVLRVVNSSLVKMSSMENMNSIAVAVIDMTMTMPSRLANVRHNAVSKQAPAVMSNRILDPATRLLDKGIATAIRTGDFNDLSAALINGADPNYQTANSSGGYTALMVASMKGNVRMVRRLLLKAVDVLATNADEKTALDLIPTKLTARNSSEVAEIKSLLLRAVDAAKLRSIAAAVMGPIDSGDISGDCVYDIFSVDGTADAAVSVSYLDNQCSTVQVEGLKIVGDGNIDIDLLLSYDSDWSDLGDDEDPDSNDERYHGNDYPDEATSDEDELFDDYNDDFNHAEDSSDDEMRPRRRMDRNYSDRMKPTDIDCISGRLNGNGSGCDVVDDEFPHELKSKNLSASNHIHTLDSSFGVGKVLRPSVIFDSDDSNMLFRVRDTETLQQLWDECPPMPEVDDGSRIDQMRTRTGMVFAGNPREFDAHGLPKYACDLSDDDVDVLCESVVGNTYSRTLWDSYSDSTNRKPPLDAVAYDSELDGESYDP